MGKLAGLARMTTATTGTGTVTLLAAVADRLTFAQAGIADGELVSYGILDLGNGNVEMGEGVYASAGPTLTRPSVNFSTNGGAAISISASGAEVFITPLPKDFGKRLIATATPTGTGVVTLSSIPQHFAHLEIQVSGRSTAGASPGVNCNATFNADTGANYDGHLVSVQNATVGSGGSAAAGTSIDPFLIPWSGATANNCGGGEFVIHNYTDTNLFKHFLFRGNTIGATTIGTTWLFRTGGGQWRSTAAITRIDLTLQAGNWAAGSRVSLYGLL